MIRPDDVTWGTDPHYGLLVDLAGAGVDAAGRMTATAARFVFMHSADDGTLTEAPIPVTLDGARALELAQELLGAATIIDPAAVQHQVAQARLETAARLGLLLPPGTVTH
jgi:hypothetical protein